jgi:hypothetical protein
MEKNFKGTENSNQFERFTGWNWNWKHPNKSVDCGE